MNKLLKLIVCFLAMSGFAEAGVYMKRFTEEPKEDNNVFWACDSTSGTGNLCTFDPDGFGPQGYVFVSAGDHVDTVYDEPGFYEVILGSAYCGGGTCGSFNTSLDRFPVAPTNGWQINLTGNKTIAKVGETVSFTATGSTGVECCTYQWDFEDGNTREDYETDGNSTQSHSFSSPGTYTVEVYLEDRETDIDLYNGSQKVRDIFRVVVEADEPEPEYEIKRIQNYWKMSEFVHVENRDPSDPYDVPESGFIEYGWASATWNFIKRGDYYNIQNRWTGEYLHVFHGYQGGLRVGNWSPDHIQAQWELIPQGEPWESNYDDYGLNLDGRVFLIRNISRPSSLFLNIESGELKLSSIEDGWWSARWVIDDVY